jgi:hypothetical protein
MAARGFRGEVAATWLDPDAAALEVAAALLRARGGKEGDVAVRAQTAGATIGAATAGTGRHHLVLAGQVLSELDVAAPDDVRVARHVDLLRALLEERVELGGALVVIEPALRDRSRHLHRVRDGLLAVGATVFAPCLHAAGCPVLAREGDWCHEDLQVELPGWLAPVARAAGLRREGLTFSYLVLRRRGPRLADAIGGAERPATRLRIVSDAIRTKGKREAFVCGEVMGPEGPVAARSRLMRLDRDSTVENAAWEELRRGDVAVVSPVPELERPRIGADSVVQLGVIVDDGERDAESR